MLRSTAQRVTVRLDTQLSIWNRPNYFWIVDFLLNSWCAFGVYPSCLLPICIQTRTHSLSLWKKERKAEWGTWSFYCCPMPMPSAVKANDMATAFPQLLFLLKRSGLSFLVSLKVARRSSSTRFTNHPPLPLHHPQASSWRYNLELIRWLLFPSLSLVLFLLFCICRFERVSSLEFNY